MTTGHAALLEAWDGVHWSRTAGFHICHDGCNPVSADAYWNLINLDWGLPDGSWPHTNQAKAVIVWLKIDANAEVDFDGTLYLGFVGEQGENDGELKIIQEFSFEHGSGRKLNHFENFWPYPMVCDTDHWIGRTKSFTGLKEENFITDPDCVGSIMVETGDVVAVWEVNSQGKNIYCSISVGYITLITDDVGYNPVLTNP